MVMVGINRYPNMAVKPINKGVITVFNDVIHIGLKINSKRLLKRLLWHMGNDIPIFMMIPISNNNHIFGLFDVIDNANGGDMVVVRMVKDEDSMTND